MIRFARFNRRSVRSLAEPLESINLEGPEIIMVRPEPSIFSALAQARDMIRREALDPERYLLGCLSFLTLVAFMYGDDMHTWRYRELLGGGHPNQMTVFGLPISVDPTKPEEWVQCLPRTSVETALYKQPPPDFGVSRGLAVRAPEDIQRVILEATPEEKLLITKGAAEELAQKVILTSYWDQKPPAPKGSKEWTGNEGKRFK